MITLWKKVGETPLQALNRLRIEQPHLQSETLSYAGRLDPMAEGILLVLVGEENKNRVQYLGLDKEYGVEIVLGIQTDTYDVLGKIISESTGNNFSEEKIKSFEKTFDQPYPPYSSKTVNGRPLFEWARKGRLSEIVVPTKSVTIKKVDLLEEREISYQDLLTQIQEKIKKIKGDFRQEEALNSWNSLRHLEYKIVKIKVSCTSGTYMRSLANAVGGVALSIQRTKIGNYGLG